MTERPIIFSGAPMVRAILSGSKSQTRRVVKYQDDLVDDDGWPLVDRSIDGIGEVRAACPYGQPGDRLWVREAWRASLAYELTPPRDIPPGNPIAYQADGAGSLPHFNAGKLRPSIHMPRWASRITLEVTGVRVERLQDISEADALAEGVSAILDEMRRATPRCDFQALWQSINGPGSWDANPWVWIVEFKRIKP